MRAGRGGWARGFAILAPLLLASPAAAYTIYSAETAGCHERVTMDALRAVRAELATAAPLAADRDERALIADLQFRPDADMRDLGAATLLVGVRDNDLKGRGSLELSQLTLVHGDPASQREHCLRGAGEKEPGGSAAAVNDCRGFVREKVAQALDGLDGAGNPDPGKRTAVGVHLELRHYVEVPLPTFYLRMGQAIHTVEDSFSHTFRTPDGMKISVVLDWVDEANQQLVVARDGPPHAQELDRCDDPDPLRARKRALATEAATAFLRTTLDPQKTRDQKLADVDALLDRYMSFSPGCTFDNNWCDAAERHYGNGSAFGCAMGRAGGGATAALAAALALLWLARRRARLLVLLAIASMGGRAVAGPTEPDPPTVVPQPGPQDQTRMAVGGYVGAGAAFTDPGAAFAVGARLRLSKHWGVGLDGEWNPWIRYNGVGVRPGVFNGYATGYARLPLVYAKFNLRTTVNLGVSRMLMDLYGAPKGTMGLFVGIYPLGLEWKWSRNFYVIINPLGLAEPIPQLRGVPFAYPQYRFTVGFETAHELPQKR